MKLLKRKFLRIWNVAKEYQTPENSWEKKKLNLIAMLSTLTIVEKITRGKRRKDLDCWLFDSDKNNEGFWTWQIQYLSITGALVSKEQSQASSWLPLIDLSVCFIFVKKTRSDKKCFKCCRLFARLASVPLSLQGGGGAAPGLRYHRLLWRQEHRAHTRNYF